MVNPPASRAPRRAPRWGVAALVLALSWVVAGGVAGAQDGPAGAPDYVVDVPDVALSGVPVAVDVTALEPPPGGLELVVGPDTYAVDLDGAGSATVEDVVFPGGSTEVELRADGEPVPFATSTGGDGVEDVARDALPGWVSLLPPLAAIALALVTRQVIVSLLVGIWLGAWLVAGPTPGALFTGLLAAFDTWMVDALAGGPGGGDSSRISILVFTILIGGLTGIVSRNGGARGIVRRLSGFARNRRRGLVTSSAVGTGMFFDDYAGMLVTGNSMRPVTDRLRISREKLAYVVDTTASPIAALLVVTTWIGFQVGLISDATEGLGGFPDGAYATFLQALPFMFYPVLAFLFMWAITATGRDFGPMAAAEQRAAGGDVAGDAETDDSAGDELEPDEGTPERAMNAVVPVAVLVVAVFVTLAVTGSGDSVSEVIGSGDSTAALMNGSVLAVLVAAALTVGQRLLSLGAVVAAWMTGFKAVLEVLVILTLAWALSDLTQSLGTAAYLTSLLGEGLPAAVLPAVLFVLTAAVSFATGTSWGAMGIILPLAGPLTWSVLGDAALVDGAVSPVFHAAIAATIAGAVWGDHASPLSDTTVLSAATSGSGVVEHTRTQLPYALVVGGVAVAALLAVGLGVPWWVVLPVAAGALLAVVLLVGSEPDEGDGPGDAVDLRADDHGPARREDARPAPA